jgi:hypothetical protein
MGHKEWPVTLKVHIEPKGLKRVVEEGRLMEFIGAFSTLASAHIRSHIAEELAKAGVGLAEVGEGVSIAIGYDVDDPYGTGPKPWPWPVPIPWPWQRMASVAIDTVPLPEMPALEEILRRIVREELQHLGK